MSVTRRVTVAVIATLALGVSGAAGAAAAPAGTGGHDDHRGDNDALIKIADNNVGPFQACNNNVSTNVLGLQGTGSDGAGTVGADNDGNDSANVKGCAQHSEQNNDGHPNRWGGGDNDSLIKVQDNNVGPFQACNNNVATNVLGGQLALSDIAGIFGYDNDHNSSTNVKGCEQESHQDN